MLSVAVARRKIRIGVRSLGWSAKLSPWSSEEFSYSVKARLEGTDGPGAGHGTRSPTGKTAGTVHCGVSDKEPGENTKDCWATARVRWLCVSLCSQARREAIQQKVRSENA